MDFNIFEIIGTIALGLCLGMLVNYISDVLPLTRELGQPLCTHCHRKPGWKKYIFSIRCSLCNKYFPTRRWVVLALFPFLLTVLWLFPPARFSFFITCVLLVYFAVIFVIDFEYRAILIPSIWVGVVVFTIVGISLHGMISTAIGGIAGFLIMFALHYLGNLFSQYVAKKRKETLNEPALGFGDVNLAGVIGLGLGWPGITAGLVVAIFLGGIVSAIYLVISLLAKRYTLFQAIPYAPFLVLAAGYLLFR